MSKRTLVTAGLPYVNGRLHVGHIAGAYLPADIYVRFLRMVGEEALWICGSDEHGVPIMMTARKENRGEREVVEEYHRRQLEDFRGLGILFDIYGGTSTSPPHKDLSQHFFRRALVGGYMEKRTAMQHYDDEAGMFLPDRFVKGTCPHCGATDAHGDQCEACGRTIDANLLVNPVSALTGKTPRLRETAHWYFKLPAFGERLREWIGTKTDWRPTVRNFALGILNDGLPERSMTRDIAWGIPVPVDDDPDAQNKVLYVWFDAPIGYVSFTEELLTSRGAEQGAYAQWWKDPECRIVHFIGEDNTVFHAIIWPAMLMAEGSFNLPTDVVANCFLNFQFPGKEEEKMSKSRGTAVWIEEYLKEFDPDPLRYYLTAIAPENARTAFNFDAFVNRNNEELVATLGNLYHRVLTFAHKYFDGRVPAAGCRDEMDDALLSGTRKLAEVVGGEIRQYHFRKALAEIMAGASRANKYFDTKEPWKTRKSAPALCGTTINVCLNVLDALTRVIAPFLPFASEKAAAMLGIEGGKLAWEPERELAEGQRLGTPAVLFEKIEKKTETDTK